MGKWGNTSDQILTFTATYYSMETGGYYNSGIFFTSLVAKF